MSRLKKRRRNNLQGAPQYAAPPETVKKTSQKMSGTEQRGVCAGGKKPTARSINRLLKRF